LIELKYIKISDYNEKLRLEKIDEACKQLDQYAKSSRVLNSIGNTKLIKIVLIYKGWEMVYCNEY